MSTTYFPKKSRRAWAPALLSSNHGGSLFQNRSDIECKRDPWNLGHTTAEHGTLTSSRPAVATPSFPAVAAAAIRVMWSTEGRIFAPTTLAILSIIVGWGSRSFSGARGWGWCVCVCACDTVCADRQRGPWSLLEGFCVVAAAFRHKSATQRFLLPLCTPPHSPASSKTTCPT